MRQILEEEKLSLTSAFLSKTGLELRFKLPFFTVILHNFNADIQGITSLTEKEKCFYCLLS